MDMPLDPPCADEAPTGPSLTEYDMQHMVTYLRLFDADRDGADWREIFRIVLHIDPDADASRARQAFDSHMSRARWMTKQGYRRLILPLG
jgi:type VI secretion system activator RovC-like protein